MLLSESTVEKILLSLFGKKSVASIGFIPKKPNSPAMPRSPEKIFLSSAMPPPTPSSIYKYIKLSGVAGFKSSDEIAADISFIISTGAPILLFTYSANFSP